MKEYEYKYGSFIEKQISETKQKMRKQVFFLLLIVDPRTSKEYEDVDVNEAFQNALYLFGGLNDLLGYPKELVTVMSLLNAAYLEYQSPDYEWQVYRKLVLDAGNAVLTIKEVNHAEP